MDASWKSERSGKAPHSGGAHDVSWRPRPMRRTRCGARTTTRRRSQQMRNACALPVAAAGALMPDAHVGYGLPIGGVLATENAVIPYAVGVDIACRMKMTVLDLPLTRPERRAGAAHRRDRARDAVRRRRRLPEAAPARGDGRRLAGVAGHRGPKDRAWAQLGTSGSGNHFVEFGALTVTDAAVGLEPGQYLALLSHSGSRGTGAQIASTTARWRGRRIPSCRRSCRSWRGSIWRRRPARSTGRRWS